jgi:hypothetical protein
MFHLIGTDGKQYGPVSLEQLRKWIREGRASRASQVQREGAPAWMLLGELPELGDLFQAPPPLTFSATHSAALPPIVRTFGRLLLACAALLLLLQVSSLFSLLWRFRGATSFPQLGLLFLFFQFLGVAGIAIRIVSGLGLLRGREWARQLAVYYAVFAILLGLYGLGQTAFWLASAGASFRWISSLRFLFSTGLGLLVLGFDVATVLCLGRKPVRAALLNYAAVPNCRGNNTRPPGAPWA